jgi:2',3'-cyclic-nucleotide 2'-phosphodiesterase (5'-nucleotidase family)
MKTSVSILKTTAFVLLAATLLWAMTPLPGQAEEPTIRFLLTSNLNGRFTVETENQEMEDPMLILAQSMLNEQKNRPADLFVDLGNAFYPGILSRFSYGSITMDFLEYFNCAATLVSSRDLNIGVSNLEFLSKKKKTRLLSANIEKDEVPVFLPHFRQTIKGKKFAFIAISSEKGFFDIAEKQLLAVTLKDYKEALKKGLEELQSEEADYTVLFSGRSYEDNFAIMEEFKGIALCISGGDSTGELFAAKAERVDIGEGRSLVTLINPNGFYSLNLSAGNVLSVDTLKFNGAEPQSTYERNYRLFVNRLSIWKKRFAKEGENDIVNEALTEMSVDDARVAALLRHKFRAEVAIVDKNSITAGKMSGKIKYSDIIKMVDNEFPIFTYKITGSELKKVIGLKENLVISGAEGGRVQKNTIMDKKDYRICSPQSVYDHLTRRLGRNMKYTNSWRTLLDEIKDDLKGDQVLGYGDYGYLDNRYRMMVDVSLSNFYDHSEVSKDAGLKTPPGKPGATYEKWGLEDKIDVTIYNQKHKVVLTPYVYFIRQDEAYSQNLLRGTLFYTYNLYPILKPYHKSQVDTVVKVVDDFKPLLIRETFGALFETKNITGKVGIGFEKQAQDPEEDLFGGIETIIGAKYDFLKYMSYTFDLDTFYSNFSEHQVRAEVTNALSFKLNSFMAFSTKYKWFYFNALDDDLKYKDGQVLLALDLVTDFKKF